jgi:hypothetical protein
VSKYLLNKFLYTVDRDPELVERYRTDTMEAYFTWYPNGVPTGGEA